MKNRVAPLRFFIENYGCQMNVSEANSLRSALIETDYVESDAPESADVVILNTCSVRKSAEDRIVGRIGYYRGLLEKKGIAISVILMGCMAEHRGLEMLSKFPDVIKVVWGTYNKEEVVKDLKNLSQKQVHTGFSEYRFADAMPHSQFPFKSYLPISHGCNNFCSYCIVPYVRGREIYRSAEEILQNIRRLANSGVLEITLLGQNVNSYRDNGISFPDLLDKIAQIDGIARIAFMTSHPKDFDRALVEVIRANPKISRAIHLPLQSGNNRILSEMNRQYTIEGYLEKMEWIRSIPDHAITTDIIVGFPGESDEEFSDTLSVMESIRYHDAFMYHYNPRSGTKAYGHKDTVPASVKLARLAELIDKQKNVWLKSRLAEKIGKTTIVLIESQSKRHQNQFSGRSHNGIMTHVQSETNIIGQIITVKIIGISGSGLKGERI